MAARPHFHHGLRITPAHHSCISHFIFRPIVDIVGDIKASIDAVSRPVSHRITAEDKRRIECCLRSVDALLRLRLCPSWHGGIPAPTEGAVLVPGPDESDEAPPSSGSDASGLLIERVYQRDYVPSDLLGSGDGGGCPAAIGGQIRGEERGLVIRKLYQTDYVPSGLRRQLASSLQAALRFLAGSP